MSTELEYEFYMGWLGRNASVFRVGISTIAPAVGSGGYDQIGYEWSPSWGSHANDNMTSMAKSFTLKRGRDNRGVLMTAGQLDVTFHDPTQILNPYNSSSPVAAYLRPKRPCRLRARLKAGPGPWIDLFYGYVRSGIGDYDIGKKEAKLHFEDFFLFLSQFKDPGPIIASTGPTYTGTAIRLVLQLLGMDNPALLDIDTGDPIPDFSADGSRGALELIGDLVSAEGGVFYIARTGKVTYEARTRRALRTSEATFGDVEYALPGWEDEQIKNVASVTKEGGVPQIYEDTISIGEFGRSAHPAEVSPYFDSDAVAASKAAWKVSQTKDPRKPIWSFGVVEGPTGYASNICNLDLQDRITVTNPDVASDYHIEQIVHTGEGGTMHSTKWQLSPPYGFDPFIVGTSTIAAAIDSVGADRISP